MKNIITEIKYTPERISSRITEAEEWINELEGRLVEITAYQWNKEWRIENSLRHFWGNIRWTNIWNIGYPEEKEKGSKTYLKRYIKKLPSHGKGNSHPSTGGAGGSNQGNPRRNIPRYMLNKLINTKYKNIKSSKGTAKNNIQSNPCKAII